jgi:hypothetical protein
MTSRILVTAAVILGIASFSFLAGSLSGTWEANLAIDPNPFSFTELSSTFAVNYTVGGFTTTSNSELLLAGFIWQGFGITGTLGAFNVQGDLLFGASTADFIYDQLIVTASIAGIDFGVYWAQLSAAVLGGPADGSVLRMAGSIGDIDIQSYFELGAQVEDTNDDNFNGITIYHAATGAHKHYVTNPLVVGRGFTGEKITISGWSFGCVDDIATTLYMTCEGFDFIEFELSGIDVGLCWLSFDVELTFKLQTKSIVLTPQINLGELACIQVYTTLLADAPNNIIYNSFTSLTRISLYGLGFTSSWDGVTVKDVTVLDTGRYAITTPEYGSVIAEIVEALEGGHEFYSEYWELFSIAVTGDGCCGGSYRFLLNTYFDRTATNLFGWGMTHVEGRFPISSMIFLTAEVEVDDDTPGLDHFGFGFEVGW